MPEPLNLDEQWYRRLTLGDEIHHNLRRILGFLPSNPRCKMCNAPFRGLGGVLMRMMGRGQSRYNPRFCDPCETFDHPGGAEVTISMLFADVRGSTTLAEKMTALEFSRLLNRFYSVATDALVRADAMVDRFVGDEVIGLFIPGMAGPKHAQRAIQAAQNLLQLTGHEDREGPWLPVGIGVHTGIAYVGVVGGTGGNLTDFTALGDNVNITARLASVAGQGEILITEAAFDAAGMEPDNLNHRLLELKGKSEPIGVHVMRLQTTT